MLRPGDRVGVVAPASTFDRETFETGLEILKSMGFQVVVPEDVFARKGYLAGPDELRAEMVNRFFADEKLKGIICARGGFGSLRVLSLLDFDTIRANPKIFVGFSDVSALLSALHSRCGLVTFHGPTITTLAKAGPVTQAALISSVASDTCINITASQGRVLNSGLAAGVVTGGNLTTLCHLLGTSFQPDFKGHILFLEDRGEAAYRIDRMLTQMKMAGCFDGVSGLVLGSFEECGRLADIDKIVKNIFQDRSIPILAGIDAGHGRENVTIPMGLPAELDTAACCLSYLESSTTV
jgi:muramoyltetrapeptide carboxypeptidase